MLSRSLSIQSQAEAKTLATPDAAQWELAVDREMAFFGSAVPPHLTLQVESIQYPTMLYVLSNSTKGIETVSWSAKQEKQSNAVCPTSITSSYSQHSFLTTCRIKVHSGKHYCSYGHVLALNVNIMNQSTMLSTAGVVD